MKNGYTNWKSRPSKGCRVCAREIITRCENGNLVELVGSNFRGNETLQVRGFLCDQSIILWMKILIEAVVIHAGYNKCNYFLDVEVPNSTGTENKTYAQFSSKLFQRSCL